MSPTFAVASLDLSLLGKIFSSPDTDLGNEITADLTFEDLLIFEVEEENYKKTDLVGREQIGTVKPLARNEQIVLLQIGPKCFDQIPYFWPDSNKSSEKVQAWSRDLRK